jgi:antitoxin component YwqK of YwqJK toxin-antitoxin module
MRARLIFTLLLIVFSSPVLAAKLDDLVERGGLAYKKFTDIPFTGEIDENHTKGKYLNGKKEGLWFFYHENGQLRKKGSFLNGEKSGEWVSYFENGKLIERQTRGMKYPASENYFWALTEGIHARVTYDRDGIVDYECNYLVDKICTSWSEGFLNYRVELKDGKKHGLEEKYENYHSLNIHYLQREAYYSEGLLHGPTASWSIDGAQYGWEMYINGELTQATVLCKDESVHSTFINSVWEELGCPPGQGPLDHLRR